MKKIIAKTNIGSEYLYMQRHTYQVSEKNADLVCSSMNKAGYQLRKNEIWKVYTVAEYTFKNAFYKAVIRQGKIRFYEIWTAC